MINLLSITLILVFIIDLSGFIQSLSKCIWNIFYKNIPYKGWVIWKPFSCSLCSSFWCGLLYLIITGTFSWYMFAYVALLAFLTPVMSDVMITIKDVFTWLVDKIHNITNH